MRRPLHILLVLVAICVTSVAHAAARAVILVDPRVEQYKETTDVLRKRIQADVTVVDVQRTGDPVVEIRRIAPDVVIAVGSKALQMAAQRLKDVPVVYCTVLYPERTLQLGPNVTGVPMEIPVEAQLRRFREVAPRVKRIGVIYTPSGSGFLVDEATAAARTLGIELVAEAVQKHADVGKALDRLLPRVDAVWLVPDAALMNKDIFRFLLGQTLAEGVPLFGFLEGFTQAGALASISPDYGEIGTLGARLANEILSSRGKLPAKVYGEGALSINLKTASRLELKVPAAVRKQARKVYE